MSLPVVLRRAARAEYDKAGDWYERKRAGLGAAFTAAVQKVFDQISARPQLYRVVLRDVRMAVVQGLPYCVFYRERRSAIVVLAVFHTSRDPSIWQSRS